MNDQDKKTLKAEELGTKSIPKLLLGYSLTTFAALLLNSIYTLTDAAFVGRVVGADALGGITAVLPFTVIQSGITTALGGGAAILVSKLLGGGTRGKAGGVVFTAAIAFWAVSLAITAAGLVFLEPLLNTLGVAEELKGYARQYLYIILIGNVFSTGFSSIMRAEGRMAYALIQWVIPISVNIILDALFVFAFGWGVRGAAWATVCCYAVSFITSMLYFVKFTSINFKGAGFSFRTLGDVVTAGLPSLVQQSILAVGMALLNNIFKKVGGEELQIMNGIISRIYMFCIVPFTAITQALQPLAGYNYGANKPERVRSAMRYTVLFSFLASLVPLALCELIPRQMLGVFTKEQSVIETGIPALRWIALAFPFGFLPSAAGVLFQSVGKKFAAVLLFSASFIFIPSFALVFSWLFGTGGVWPAFPAAGIFAAFIASVPLAGFFRKYG